MADLKWGQVYYRDILSGIIREEPGNRYSFTYDPSYLASAHPAIGFTLPLQSEPFFSTSFIHPFFDNLVAEGWMERAQTRLLGKQITSRFELLLAFGRDCAGAVSILDPTPTTLTNSLLAQDSPIENAMLANRASLSGIQPKLPVVQRGNKFYPAQFNETSTHIAKFSSANHSDLVLNEYLTTLAFKALLPNDDCVEMSLGKLEGFEQPVLLIKRFDRNENTRIHFEEFNAILGHYAHNKYDGSYLQMANFIYNTPGCLPAEVFRLYARILAGVLVSNTDMHLKNFALFHTPEGLRLTPAYDEVAASLYQYKTMALTLGGAPNLQIGDLKPRNLIALGKEFRLGPSAIHIVFKQLEKNLDAALHAILSATYDGSSVMKNKLITMVRKRWNGTFALIGQILSKKP